jgi:hypothetical protein
MEWALEDAPKNIEEKRVRDFLLKRTKNAKVANTVGKILDLFAYLKSKKFKTAEQLRNSVFVDSKHKKPLFSVKQSEVLVEFFKQKGGGGVIIERLVGRVTDSIEANLPTVIEGPIKIIKPWVFILESLEKNPSFCPFISIGLDEASHSLPVIASTIENITPELAGLIPIPESSTIGIAVGWFIAAQFTLLSMALNMSRGHFDEVFINSLLLIPLAGTSLHNAAMKGDDFITETAGKRAKLINAIHSAPLLGPPVAAVLDNFIPDLLYDPENPEHVAEQKEKERKATEAVSTIKDKAKAHIANVTAKASEQVTTLKNKANERIDTLKNSDQFKQANEKFTTLKSKATEKFNTLRTASAAGGKRFSTRKHGYTKWRTQRKRFARH